jgi:membrane fusion protein (multidrug efflux system)
MRKRTFAAVLGVGLIAVSAGVYAVRQHGDPRAAQNANAATQPRGGAVGVPVETATARAATTTTDIRAIGSLQSDESVKIAPEVPGRIAEIALKEGEPVKKGDILIRLDDSLVRAEIAEQEARYELAKSNIDRANQLARTGSVTERARDEAKAAFDTAIATLELARVRLAKHTILAPFSGVVGLRSVSVGAFVAVGTELVNVEKIDALKLDFSIPELFLASVKVGQEVQVAVDALPGRTFAGTVYAIDPMVDVNGRALSVRARLANADSVLRPGLFARVTLKGPTKQNIVLIPESAIVPRGAESFVYRIEGGKAVEAKVRLGERKAGQVEILEGLNAGATVVAAGQQRLRNGARVDIVRFDPRATGATP